jgi:hypothetical protein
MPDEAEIVAGAAKGTAEGLIKPFSDLLAKLLGSVASSARPRGTSTASPPGLPSPRLDRVGPVR